MVIDCLDEFVLFECVECDVGFDVGIVVVYCYVVVVWMIFVWIVMFDYGVGLVDG